jgi:arylsulfatase A-like enzyme
MDVTAFRYNGDYHSPLYAADLLLMMITRSLLIACVLLLADAFSVDLLRANSPPNIVLIFVDDLGYGDLGCYGATKVKTPNIDRLAREGRRFTDAHSASSVCTPSRYALLTGEYPFRKNLWGPVMNPSPLVVDPQTTTIASLLRRQGYATACFGKWHLGFGSQKNPDWNVDLKPGPLELGFDHFFGIPVVNSHPPFVFVEDHRVVGLDPADPLVYGGKPPTQIFPAKMMSPAISGGKAAHLLYRDEELGDTLTEKAIDWIRAQRESPFFLYFATPQIHHPFTPHPRFRGTSECGLYGDFIHELDWMVGEVMKTLDELKLREKTLVILTSDNGGMLNEGGQEAWKAGHRLNGNMFGFKFDAWEGGHRVPFIARWPGQIEAGSESSQLICHIDMLATFAALSGASLLEQDGPDSFNILPAMLTQPGVPIRDHVVLAPNRKENLAIRQANWLYIGAQGGGGFNGKEPGDHSLGGPAALRFTGQTHSDIENGKLKPGVPKAQLYNLANDAGQTRNVIREHPDIADKLKRLLNECQTKTRTAPALK